MPIYDLYGIKLTDLDAARRLLEETLVISFVPRSSTYHGDYYSYGKIGAENFLLKKNIDPLDGEPAELAFGSYEILLYVNDTNRSNELRNQLLAAGDVLTLLKHEDIERRATKNES